MDSEAEVLLLRTILQECSINSVASISLGELVLDHASDLSNMNILQEKLNDTGMYLIFSHREILAEKIKHLVNSLLEDEDADKSNFPKYISDRLHLNYNYLSGVFHKTLQVTIEQYLIQKRINHAEQLLTGHGLSVGAVARKLGYSTVGHFSTQFKKVTGRAPAVFKKSRKKMLVTHQIFE